MSASQPHRRVLGATIRARRTKSGWSQEKLAEKAGLSTVFISRVERGVESPSFDSLVKIAKALRVRVRALVNDI
jgi:transcriptional regulator with XRE-family HTH domain